MNDCKPIYMWNKCFAIDEGGKVDSTLHKSIFGSLRYLTRNISFGVGIVTREKESPTTTHLKAVKEIYFIHTWMISSLLIISILIGLQITIIEKV